MSVNVNTLNLQVARANDSSELTAVGCPSAPLSPPAAALCSPRLVTTPASERALLRWGRRRLLSLLLRLPTSAHPRRLSRARGLAPAAGRGWRGRAPTRRRAAGGAVGVEGADLHLVARVLVVRGGGGCAVWWHQSWNIFSYVNTFDSHLTSGITIIRHLKRQSVH